MNISTVCAIGLSMLVVAVISYVYIYLEGRHALKPLRWSARLADVVSHLPDDTSKAWPHVIGGVFGFGGLSVLASGLLDMMLTLGLHLTIEISGVFFALLVSIIAFWTLWQTKRIEQNQATEMFGFKALIGEMTKTISDLTGEIFQHPNQGFPRFRLLLVTTNPYFGVLSYLGAKETIDYRNSMTTASECVSKGLRFRVLCGDENAISEFNARYYTKEGAITDAANLVKSNVESARLISDLPGATIQRAVRVPKIQFAVVGNVVLEFILESGEGNTEIQRYKKTHEKVVADRFEDFFNELCALLAHAAGGQAAAGTTSVPAIPPASANPSSVPAPTQ